MKKRLRRLGQKLPNGKGTETRRAFPLLVCFSSRAPLSGVSLSLCFPRFLSVGQWNKKYLHLLSFSSKCVLRVFCLFVWREAFSFPLDTDSVDINILFSLRITIKPTLPITVERPPSA